MCPGWKMDTWRGALPQCPLNLSTYVWTSTCRVEMEWVVCLFKSLGHFRTRVTWNSNEDHIHRGHLSDCTPLWDVFLGGLFFRIPRVLGPYKEGPPTSLIVLFWFLVFSFSRSWSFLFSVFAFSLSLRRSSLTFHYFWPPFSSLLLANFLSLESIHLWLR